MKGGVVDERETEMMAVRWKMFNFNRQIPQDEQREIKPCAACFACLILEDYIRLPGLNIFKHEIRLNELEI